MGGKTTHSVIEWSWAGLLRAWLGNAQPQWSPTYWVVVRTLGEQCRVHLQSVGKLDVDFNPEELTRSGDLLEFSPQADFDKFRLPFGSYWVSVDKAGCETFIIPQPVRAPLGADMIDLSGMKCETP